jgi:hypothetical protein
MKRIIFSLGLILSFLTLAYAQDQNQVETDRDVGNPSRQVTPLDEAGRLTGVVLNVDRTEGVVEIRTSDGGISRLKVDQGAEGDLNKIKPGDRIVATLSIEATSIEPEAGG